MFTKEMYTEDDDLPEDHYTETEMEEIEKMFMGMESEARKRFQKQNSFRRWPFMKPISRSQNSRLGNSLRYPRFDGRRSGDDDRNHY